MSSRAFWGAFAIGTAAFLPMEAVGQTAENDPVSEEAAPAATVPAAPGEPPAAGAPEVSGDVPAVEVIQPQAEPVQRREPVRAEAAPTPRPRPVSRPAPQPVVSAPPPPPPAAFEPIEPELVLPNLITQPAPEFYGPPGGVESFERSVNSAQSPIVPTQGIVPGNLQDFSSAASRVTREKINEQDPLTTNDVLSTIPGVQIINDDGMGRHGGIGIRGTPARRSRKVLVMEDGRSINQSLWLDPSTHYTPPTERLESVEVLRGTVITYGPNNNSGVVNFRNLQPFGPNESVASFQTGAVSVEGPGLDDGDATKWHVHTRQTSGNWGLVLSYTGANGQGAWDTERLRYNDFYGAIGWKGEKSDFTFSTVYFAQRDNYDESNLEGEDDDPPGQVERLLLNNYKHCKTCFNPASGLNEYNADLWLLQGVYNYYLDADTTISARAYGQFLKRYRYFNLEGENPLEAETSFNPFIAGDEVFIPEGVMEGRLREYDNFGTELRTELANRQFLFGMSQDLQMGIRYEYNSFNDQNILGRQGRILNDFDTNGLTFFHRKHEADAVSAFVQTDISVYDNLNIVPGARLDHYRITRKTLALPGEDDEEFDECPGGAFGGEECVVIEGFNGTPYTESFEKTHVLPGVAFAYGFGRQDVQTNLGSKSLGPVTMQKPTYANTLYGGYHRGLTMGVLREAAFPPGDELGDNFQLGVRSTAIKGLTFDVAAFHQNIQDYQIKGSTTDVAGNNVYSLINEVHVNGFEAYGRLDTRPYTGWTLNPFLEGSFTLADNKIEDGFNENGQSVAGNYVPEVPREFAYLTVGIESLKGWNASISWTYRGSFYTDEDNTPFGGDPEGENGEVPSVWLLSARGNYTIPDTNMALFVSGQNLTDELYITDREDGVKPGIGRTIMAGARLKW
ncbi:TonB-dependent receptor [Methyloceanibacter sp.]|uniref:TonB-dependent receptor family protein n=1 Tax=Methyloceanibacter sp. TaxID=1965321 RepID=UPI002C942D48|nr:TonB-dependent receptor [Methyloceanibacter sp.]HML93574.1 TonB-dependent receptor plug domain-containing protein [Methyloceanibacter sp.]